MNIGNEIKRRRKARQLTQTQLANLVGTTQGRIGDWERCDVAPSLENLRRLAHELGQFVIGSNRADSPPDERAEHEADDDASGDP
jgi:transcriptional regulator with XRE-family HTH domain